MTRTHLISILPVLALLAASQPVLAEAGRSCRVERLEGTNVRYRQGEDWVALTLTELPPGATRVETGSQTRIEIACSDGTLITIGFGTRVDLRGLTAPPGGAGDVLLDLVEGIIGIVAPQQSWTSFRVRTPLAIASIRSTEWLVEHVATEQSAVFVRRGEVLVTSGGADRRLAAGEGVTIPAAGAPGPVIAWGRARIARAGAALGFGWQ